MGTRSKLHPPKQLRKKPSWSSTPWSLVTSGTGARLDQARVAAKMAELQKLVELPVSADLSRGPDGFDFGSGEPPFAGPATVERATASLATN